MNIEKQEKLKKLESIKPILKSEFVGIDNIIDNLIVSITPWFVTPEILNRPLVISLWGITGTGKTSLVRRVLELLGDCRAVFIDSGEINTSNYRDALTEAVTNTLGLEDRTSSDGLEDTVFVFDEFQHARTIDDEGKEMTNASIRQMWNIIDNGVLEIREYVYHSMRISAFIEDLRSMSRLLPGPILDNLVVKDPKHVKTIVETIGFSWYQDRATSLFNRFGKSETNIEDFDPEVEEEAPRPEKEDKRDPLRPLELLTERLITTIFIIVSKREDISSEDILNRLCACTTIAEVLEILESIKGETFGQKRFDFKHSLIFLIGNLDEAFYGYNDTDPDLDPDLFRESIGSVTISDIKNALKKRFRAEQIARFGNIILKYPALSSQDYRTIIRKELDRVLGCFDETYKKKIIYTDDIVELIAEESIYPSQGVRPILTTISNLLTPLLSSVLIDFQDENVIEAGVLGGENGFRVDSVEIYFKSGDKIEKHPLLLELGKSRNTKNNKEAYIIGVHEAGHAIIQTYLSGILPIRVISTSAADKGGRCVNGVDKTRRPMITKKQVKDEICSLLAGWVAETLVFGKNSKHGEDDLLSLGSGTDLKRAYEILSDNILECGYVYPAKFCSLEVQSNGHGFPAGIDMRSANLNEVIRQELVEQEHRAMYILKENKELLLRTGLLVAERGIITSEDFHNLIEACGNTLNLQRLEEAHEENSIERYRNIILEELGD